MANYFGFPSFLMAPAAASLGASALSLLRKGFGSLRNWALQSSQQNAITSPSCTTVLAGSTGLPETGQSAFTAAALVETVGAGVTPSSTVTWASRILA